VLSSTLITQPGSKVTRGLEVFNTGTLMPNKNLISSLFVLSILSWSPLWAAGKASSDLSGLEEGTRALVAKERARQMMFKSDGDRRMAEGDKALSDGSSSNGPKGLDDRRPVVKSGGVTGGCNMDIGNTETRPGSVGSKPKPVIITGPVVQLCK